MPRSRSETQAAVEPVPAKVPAEIPFGLLEAVEPVDEPLVVEVAGGLVDSRPGELACELGLLRQIAGEPLDRSVLESRTGDVVPGVAELDVAGARSEPPLEVDVLLRCQGLEAGGEIGVELPFEVVQLRCCRVGTAVDEYRSISVLQTPPR